MSTNPPAGRNVDYVTLADRVRVVDADVSVVVTEALAAHAKAIAVGEAQVATALHVGGLNALSTPEFLSALERARLVYADGVAVVALAKLSGASNIQRAATTDIGVPILQGLASLLDRRVRTALVGGPLDLAETAGVELGRLAEIEVVYTTHGYKDELSWKSALEELSASAPDVVLLGLGSPQELLFADRNIRDFPPALILTCGGWFGFLAGEEPRAHPLLQKMGLEWVRRLLHDPSRLAARYARGSLVTIGLACAILLRRARPE